MSKKEAKPEKPKETVPESIASFAATFVAGLFIITFVMQMFSIPSSSMERTLLIGDHVFVDRLMPAPKAGYLGPLMPYRDIHRGDLAVFMSPAEPGLHLVKRIVGVPGDRIHLSNGVLFLNGVKQSEPYVIHSRGDYDAYRDEFPSYPPDGFLDTPPDWPAVLRQNIQGDDLVVPAGYYFGMGDNRQASKDSRYWGFIPQGNIIGRPLFVLWSFETKESDGKETWSERVGFVFYATLHFFDKTRWRRTFYFAH
ncbi:MAG TPA: signal peptidase I [Alphaproteobacteria bacterium]|nr:signal peptidase I [Alphaproteobacteria bacterium]